MPVGGVIDHEIDQHANATAARLVHELDEVAARAEARVHAVEVGDVVAVVAARRRLERCKPDRVDAEALEVVESPRQPLEVAAAVAVCVEERLDVEAVDDCVLVPEVVDHAFALPGGSRTNHRSGPVTRLTPAVVRTKTGQL